jgi:hypothetical protein
VAYVAHTSHLLAIVPGFTRCIPSKLQNVVDHTPHRSPGLDVSHRGQCVYTDHITLLLLSIIYVLYRTPCKDQTLGSEFNIFEQLGSRL